MKDAPSVVLFATAGGSGHRPRGGRLMTDMPSVTPFATAERAAMGGEAGGP